ncbi:MAG: hypothetical protein HY840_02865 [Bacteroidetes bacterium]|nr:hypothetical protein [Bacteroidota bacterium]
MTAFATQILNNGASLKIISADGTRNILKNQIHEVSVINDTVIKIDIGQGALNNIFINFPEVSNPQTPTPDALVDAINIMLQNTIVIPPGISTELNQQKEITDLDSIKSSLLFQAPQISDETNPKTIYKGFAVPGSRTSDAVWAIQKITNNRGIYTYLWAGGNQNFDKVWDNRATLIYPPSANA